ncbi:hypothetical protein, conserved in T. vivax [Trypanosoma vivax Y486]|uniref:Retrotransposon hot spot (RHS) protein n=1 Tax=Trypanosoma vivax (strain Y486) TaxID=1055687 RepID=F9WN73_TRYVY|nr:hypothetical protein, conserved in T. vivax [Trypanosoma vivax Y486]|eukprot:CCD18988.1 hypothetical protein, conserved in T. vivax [Trypanosoma vivax Y486]
MEVRGGNVSEEVIGSEMLWKEEEVSFISNPDDEVDEQRNRNDGIEIFVLTSTLGWPSVKCCESHPAVMAVPQDFYCALFVRREVVRVWYLVKKCLDAVHGGAAGETTRPFTLIGSPGIGKSFGAGAFLLYMLLHYDPSCLHIVAWFIGDFVYVFLKNTQSGKVLKFYDRMHAEVYIEGQVAAGLRVYVIYDVGGNQIGPASNWRPGWPGILITSPNESNYRVWAKEHMARPIYINCHHVREIKAIHVWMERLCHPNSTVREVKDRWTELSERINVVGPLLRYVLFAHNYVEREREVEAALLELDNDMMDLYERVLIEKAAWRESKSSHKLVKLFRVHRDGCGENYRNTGVSVKVSQTLMRMVLQRKHSAEGRERVLRAVALNYGRGSAHLFETYTIYTFLQKELFEPVAHNLVKLYRRQRKEPPECDSVIRRRDSAVLYPKELALIQKGDNRKLKCGVMYVPLDSSFPVIDGFFVVEGEPWTVVAL